jgi:tetratricopeptide (TPR) repeat protein
MSETKRTFTDWIWTVVGIGGILFILIAILMIVLPHFEKDPAEADPAQAADKLWEGAKEKFAAGDPSGAAEDLRRALVLVEGRHPGYLNDLGEALLLAGDADKAPPNWLAAISLRPFFWKPYLNLARWRDARGEKAMALARYRAALALHPGPVPEDLPARVAELMAEFDEKITEEQTKLRQKLHANPGDLGAVSGLLLVDLSMLKVPADGVAAEGLRRAVQSVGEGIEDLAGLKLRQEAAVADRPDSSVDVAGLGTVLLLGGEYEKAFDTFTRALQLSAGDAMSNFGGALAALLCGHADDPGIEKAAQGFRVNPVSWLALGAASLERGEVEKAQKELLQALRCNPALPETYRLLALTFPREGQGDDRAAALRGYERLGK